MKLAVIFLTISVAYPTVHYFLAGSFIFIYALVFFLAAPFCFIFSITHWFHIFLPILCGAFLSAVVIIFGINVRVSVNDTMEPIIKKGSIVIYSSMFYNIEVNDLFIFKKDNKVIVGKAIQKINNVIYASKISEDVVFTVTPNETQGKVITWL